MNKFDIITESDARVLTRGETVMLARRGHITPLAQDTLKDRRVIVIAEDSLSTDDASLVEATGVDVVTVTGSREAFKVTTALDVTVAEAVLAARSAHVL